LLRYYLTIAERWFCAKPGKIMRLISLLQRPRFPNTLFVLPFLALMLATSAIAEPASNPPSAGNGSNPPSAQNDGNPPAQNGGNPPSAEVKPNASAEQPAGAQPKPAPAPAQPKSKAAAAPLDGEAGGNGSQILVNIDKSRQEMTVFVDGIEKYTWPVSTGKRGYSTPSGTYTASSMNEIWYSKQWDNAPMPHAIFYMKDGHAIHGTLEERNLGKPASHGCVRISRANATTLYGLVKETGLKNTQVVLSGTTPGGEAQVATQPAYPRYGEGYGAPWFGPGPGYDPRDDRPRRGLFGGWFRQQPYGGPQNYYRPPPPRGYYRGY
jgi:lipoprotein-anchoring transpeptidase ErfK/SrfK